MSALMSAITGHHLLIAAAVLVAAIFIAVMLLGDFGNRPWKRKGRDKHRAF